MRGVRRSLREEWRQIRGAVPLLPRKDEVVRKARPLQVSLANQGVKYDLIAQEVESAEYRRGMSSTYTTRKRTRGVVLHMLGGQEACTEGAMIHKAAVRRCGHRGGTKGAHRRALMHT